MKIRNFKSKDYQLVPLALKIVLATVIVAIYLKSSAHHFIESRLSTKIFFSIRNGLDRDQTLNPRLKIYSFDDSSFATLKAPSLSLKTWVEILEGLDRRAPEAVFIDQIFALTPESGKEKEQLLKRLAAIKTPVVTAAFITPQEIKTRQKMDLERYEYRLRDMFVDDYYMLTKPFPPFTDRVGWAAYGPSPDLAPAFHIQGHVMNAEGGYVNTLLKLTPRVAIPHLSLIGGNTVKIGNGKIFWNGRSIPINSRGDILADFRNPRVYYKNSKRMLGLIKTASAGEEISEVQRDDIVLLLPSMFTGSVDFTESPVGKLPGGFVIATMLNSRLNEKWFSYHEPMNGIVWLGLIGAVLTLVVSSVWVLPAIMLSLVLVIGTCIAMFVWFSTVTSLSGAVFAAVCFTSAAMFQKFNLFQRLNKMVRFLRDENSLMQSELQQANEISRVFVPVETPPWEGFEIGTYHKPMTMGSGDWYTFEVSTSGKFLHYVMCDISGHGVQAAIVVSTCKTVMSMLVAEQPELLESVLFIEKYIKILNQTLLNQGQGRHTATMVAAAFARGSSVVHVAVCGHPRPIQFQADQKDNPVFVGKPTSIVGISEPLDVHMTSFTLKPNDSLIMYTDGVEFPRVLSKIVPFYRRYRHVDANTAAKFLVSDVRERKKDFGGIAQDDVSLVWFRKLKADASKKVS